MKERILITGANGFVGQQLVHALLKKGYEVIALGKGTQRLNIASHEDFSYFDIDITNDLLTQQVIEKVRPQIIVHAAAMTQPNDCQQNQEACEAVNVRATAQLLLSAETFARYFIYISTDMVYDGSKEQYTEDDDLNPVNWYGFTKVQAEAIVETSEIPFAIVRTSLVYGNTGAGNRNNLVSWVKQNLEAGNNIKVVSDQWRTPTYVNDLVNGIVLLLEQQATGIFHLAGKDVLTPYDMAMQTAAYYKLDAALIEKVDQTSFSEPARRPRRTFLNIDKASRELGYMPVSFAEGLALMQSV